MLGNIPFNGWVIQRKSDGLFFQSLNDQHDWTNPSMSDVFYEKEFAERYITEKSHLFPESDEYKILHLNGYFIFTLQ